jgi:tetratricopeptide (TPR) repeat protein
MLAHLGLTLACLGYVEQGRARQSEALLEARRLGHAQTLAEVLTSGATIEAITNSPHGMQRYAAELLTLSTEHDLAFFSGWATVFRGRSLVAVGYTREGFVLLTEGISLLRATGSASSASQMWLAEAHAKLGRIVEGITCLVEAAEFIERTEQRVGEPELHRLRGDLLNASGDRSAAEQSYHRSLSVAERQNAKLFELRAAVSLAQLWRGQGKRAKARHLLSPIYGWFSEGFDAPVLQDAKTLLDQLA